MDLQTRQLRHFVVLAEELHFTRAAARLHLAQQALSSQIARLEEQVGARLFERTTRSVALTDAGAALLEETRHALVALDRGIRAARSHQRRHASVLRLGFMVSAALELTRPIVHEFEESHPGIKLEMEEFRYDDPSVGLATGDVEVALLRPPLSTPNLEFEVLFVEPRVIAVPDDDPIAARPAVSVHEILDRPLFYPRSNDPLWTAFWMLEDHREGRRAPLATCVTTLAEEIEGVATGKGFVITALAAARYAAHPGVTFVPIEDIPGSEAAVGWRADRETWAVTEFIDVAKQVRDRERALIERITGVPGQRDRCPEGSAQSRSLVYARTGDGAPGRITL